ncbi:DUF3093 domain-containing protein [Oerskovia turbata]|uniref:DUF3093 domain-containing protein n=1 Tax=Oerskovia turbata TaxID=1713 RepID=A0A4Q1KPL0_9CELL|nr:DUF3093 domain-containing protein [Oerskovia turbata]RXR23178.1 DUF3093 domain-containing protein [Oerskovia turbata]RXR31918.1 DUF3093 domain-containing protein [Oerskovia turbata]
MPQPAPDYSERLLPGPGGWSAAVAFAAVLGVALWPVDDVLSISTATVALVVLVALAWWTSPVVSVSPGPDGRTLRAGRATIPTSLLGATTVLDRAAMTRELGPSLDARAYVCLRAWARTGVRVEIVDPADPTPYWLVSTRRPAELAATLAASGGPAPRPGASATGPEASGATTDAGPAPR